MNTVQNFRAFLAVVETGSFSGAARRDAARALREEQEVLRGALRLVTAERDLAEERLRAYRRAILSRSRQRLHASSVVGC